MNLSSVFEDSRLGFQQQVMVLRIDFHSIGPR